MKITIKRGSVVYADCDCIVNAANQGLIQGGGVCGAIFYQARGRLTEECNAIGHCPTGHAVMTNGYELNARHIIHAVGPIYRSDNDSVALASAYRNSLVLADVNNLKSIAFCSISTGIYGYPLDKAAEIALKAIIDFKPQSLKECYMYCFQDEEYEVYSNTLKKLEGEEKWIHKLEFM